MKLEVTEDYGIVLKEVYSGVGLETSEGNFIGICMRDDTFEINVIPKGEKEHKWFRVNMQDKTIQSFADLGVTSDEVTPSSTCTEPC